MVVDEYFSDLATDPADQRGVKSPSSLLSALGAPTHTFGGKDLHPDVLTKAAVLMRSMVVNHPFHNGNKRTAVIATILFLEDNGYELRISDRKLIRLATEIASFPISVQRIRRWLKKSTRRLDKAKTDTFRRTYVSKIVQWFWGGS